MSTIMHRPNRPKKVLVLGSGALKIGQAGEFDYSGTQALKALKEEGIESVLINPNIATVQTDGQFADKIYFLPVTPYFVEKVIALEGVDSILLGFGGQTALNCGLALEESGVLARYGVRVLGTPVASIRDTEDRHLFVQRLNEIGVKTARSFAVTDAQAAVRAALEIGFPVMLRSAFSLGGQGSSIVRSEAECRAAVETAFASVSQILVEECLYGWKEVEYEVVRDARDGCITVCNMENVDPMGIHTGESIVVAPSQTLDDQEYQLLRDIAIRVIRHLGIVGECNIQYALDPNTVDYRVIEVNARLSRSSALASKATGYPLAYVAAKISLGYSLPEIANSVTQVTTAFFEPALDYIVCKFPRWDLQKFDGADHTIGTEMKSVGEVMAIGRTFPEALQKAIRMTEVGADGLDPDAFDFADLPAALRQPSTRRIFAVARAFAQGMSITEVAELTRIDPFFLGEISRIVLERQALSAGILESAGELKAAKLTGFSDRTIALKLGVSEEQVRKTRLRLGVYPRLAQIDTLAAEFPAETRFDYFTYAADVSDFPSVRTEVSQTQPVQDKPKILILGSGCYRIGSSVEFDWCAVNASYAARELGYETILLNCNPETVSTDYDMSDHLIFDEISLETVLEVYRQQSPVGVIVAMGGQTSNALALKLHEAGVKILGTSAQSIDTAEDRGRFSALLDRLGISQPKWAEARALSELDDLVRDLGGFPVLVRPSYVLSGSAMRVACTREELSLFLERASAISPSHPVVLSKFEEGWREVEVDAVAHLGTAIHRIVSEHIENAGVHSGDATLICPPQGLPAVAVQGSLEIADKLAAALEITGPFNIQLLSRGAELKVIECNLRASRSFPFVSKTSGINLIHQATRMMLGAWKEDSHAAKDAGKLATIARVGVKSPQFSFARMKGADPRLGVEMASTGEAACFGQDAEEALLKALLATGYRIPEKGIFLALPPGDRVLNLSPLIDFASKAGLPVYSDSKWSRAMRAEGLPAALCCEIGESDTPQGNLVGAETALFKGKKVDLVICIPAGWGAAADPRGYGIRRAAVDLGVPLVTDELLANRFLTALSRYPQENLEVRHYRDYFENPAVSEPGGYHDIQKAGKPIKLFVRQSFTECGKEEQTVVQGVLDLLGGSFGEMSAVPLQVLTGTKAEDRESFKQSFERATGRSFTPQSFRNHRLSLLGQAQAMMVLRTGMSESGAFELAYNLFGGRNVPVFFANWRKTPIKTTLLRELEDLGQIVYHEFDSPRELLVPLIRFLAQFRGMS